MLSFCIYQTNITLTFLKRCKTVTSKEVNATKNVSISDGINKHVIQFYDRNITGTINWDKKKQTGNICKQVMAV